MDEKYSISQFNYLLDSFFEHNKQIIKNVKKVFDILFVNVYTIYSDPRVKFCLIYLILS